MKTRTMNNRNFIGGFIGGLSGILTFALLHKMLLPVGCIVGVVMGYWYKEIFQRTRTSLKKQLARVKMIADVLIERKLKSILAEAIRLRVIKILILKKKLSGIVRKKRLAMKISKKKVARKYDGAIRKLKLKASFVVILCLIIPLYIVISQIRFLSSSMTEGSLVSTLFVMLTTMTLMLISMLAIIVLLLCSFDFSAKRSKKLHKALRMIKNNEKFTYSFLREMLYAQFLVAITIFSIVFYAVVFGALTILLVAITSIGKVMAEVLHFLSERSEHWACTVATLTITTISAWKLGPYIDNEITLWSVAFTTGFVSGFAAVGCSRALSWAGEKEFVQKLREIDIAEMFPSIWEFVKGLSREFFRGEESPIFKIRCRAFATD